MNLSLNVDHKMLTRFVHRKSTSVAVVTHPKN